MSRRPAPNPSGCRSAGGAAVSESTTQRCSDGMTGRPGRIGISRGTPSAHLLDCRAVWAAAALTGAALSAALPAARAQALVSGSQTLQVPRRTNALVTAINTANSRRSALVVLPRNCTYNITTPAIAADGLPAITGHITLAGGANTVIRHLTPTALRILDVAVGGTLSLNSISVLGGSTSGLGGGIQNAGSLTLDQARLPETRRAMAARSRISQARPRKFPIPRSTRTRQPASEAAALTTRVL
jgi:hypothetical protein